MSSDYSYDEQGQFYPFFIFTVTTIVTLPLTYSLLAPTTDAAALAPRIQTSYKPEHADLIQAQRAAQKRKQRRIKRAIATVLGWAVMAGMLYLIVTTQRTVAKIWNPYDILGVSEVRFFHPRMFRDSSSINIIHYSRPPRSRSNPTTGSSASSFTRTRPDRTRPRTRHSRL